MGGAAAGPAQGRVVQAEELVRSPANAKVLRGIALVPTAELSTAIALRPNGALITLRLPDRRGRSDVTRVRVKSVRCGSSLLRLTTNRARTSWVGSSWGLVDVKTNGDYLRLRAAPAAEGRKRCRMFVDSVEMVESVPVGTAVWTRHLDADPRYGKTFVENFATVTPENELKMAVVHPDKDRYDFAGADRLVELAEQHGKAVHGHVLIWGEHLPGWITQRDAFGRTVWTKDALRAALRDHVLTVVGRYKGRVRQWDVVNEAVEWDGRLKRNFLLDALGPEYIELAFRWAQEADPSARLFINEKDADVVNPRSTALLSLVRELRAKGLRVDGVGLQNHLSIAAVPSRTQLYENWKRFSDAGFAVRVSELDATRENLQPDDVARGQLYDNVAGACLLTPRCENVTVWGVSDAVSWLGAGDGPLPFDANYEPKLFWGPFTAKLAGRGPLF